MKIHKSFALGLLVISASLAIAQSARDQTPVQSTYFSQRATIEAADLGKVVELYMASLASENNGVVESVIAHLTHLRIVAYDQDLGGVETHLMGLARDGASQSIREKASLALQVFAYPAAFQSLADRDFEGPDELFEAVGARLQLAF